MRKIVPVILCGGTGSRLWPLSRESYPKQFLSLDPSNNLSMLQLTFKRISKIENIDNPILICNEEHRFITAEQMRQIEVTPKTILLEPFGKGTAPAIALAALKVIDLGENPVLLILSSDHLINNEYKFIEAIKKGMTLADEDFLVTFGIVPNSPETGYGYIETNNEINRDETEAYVIKKFIEKPNFKDAKRFSTDKNYLWNSGIFMFKAQTIIDEFNNHAPEIIKKCKRSLTNKLIDLEFERLSRTEFQNCPNISFDVAIMEKTNKGRTVPLNADWSDVGSWDKVWEISTKDSNGISRKGNTITMDSKNSLLISENRLIVGIGIENLIIIETGDAILVMEKTHSQKVKFVVENLKKQKILEGQEHKKIFRPWGNYTSIVEGKNWKVKKIIVKPKQSISLQKHNYRSEHWIVVNGKAKVELENKIIDLCENQSIYIPLGCKHRLSNSGDSNLILIEVQSGEYLGEDDIIRFEDNYGRVN